MLPLNFVFTELTPQKPLNIKHDDVVYILGSNGEEETLSEALNKRFYENKTDQYEFNCNLTSNVTTIGLAEKSKASKKHIQGDALSLPVPNDIDLLYLELFPTFFPAARNNMTLKNLLRITPLVITKWIKGLKPNAEFAYEWIPYFMHINKNELMQNFQVDSLERLYEINPFSGYLTKELLQNDNQSNLDIAIQTTVDILRINDKHKKRVEQSLNDYINNFREVKDHFKYFLDTHNEMPLIQVFFDVLTLHTQQSYMIQFLEKHGLININFRFIRTKNLVNQRRSTLLICGTAKS